MGKTLLSVSGRFAVNGSKNSRTAVLKQSGFAKFQHKRKFFSDHDQTVRINILVNVAVRVTSAA